MGTCERGEHNEYRSIRTNVIRMQDTFPLREGYFGTPGRSSNPHVRNIVSDAPLKTATIFFQRIADGSHIEHRQTSKGGKLFLAYLSDGGIISFRDSSSSDGTPVVEINILHSSDHGSVKQQKIHFVKGVTK